MLKSFVEFEFLKRNDSEMVEKLLRVFANFFVTEKEALDFIKNYNSSYKLLLKHIRFFINKSNKDNDALLMSLFGFLTNIFYHESNVLVFNDFELKTLKFDLVAGICLMVTIPVNEPALSEGLRVLANLSRNKQLAKHICNINFGEGLMALLSHSSHSVVYNALGCLINISNEKLFYQKEVDKAFLEHMNKIQRTEEETYLLSLKVFCNIFNYYKNEQKDISCFEFTLKKIELENNTENNKENHGQNECQIKDIIRFIRKENLDSVKRVGFKLNELLQG